MINFIKKIGCAGAVALALSGGCIHSAYAQSEDSKRQFGKIERYALNGSPEAQFALGIFYEFGEGVEANPEKALRYYKMALKNNSPKAAFHLSAKYQTGDMVEQDLEKADDLLDKAIHYGLPEAVLYKAKRLIVGYQNGDAELAGNEAIEEIWELLNRKTVKYNSEARYFRAVLSVDKSFPRSLSSDELERELKYLHTLNYRNGSELYTALYPQAESNTGRREAPNEPGVERITVHGNKLELDLVLTNLVGDIKAEGLYNSNSNTGSRIPGRSCSKFSNPPCKVEAPSVIPGNDAASALSGN
jgi:hypothetical protein